MTGDATPAPVLLPAPKPCPACGHEGRYSVDDYGIWVECDSCGESDDQTCWRGPRRDTYPEAGDAWNALPRLVDGLRPEPAPPSLDTLRADLAWIRRALVALAERHGVTLPFTPRKAQT